MVLGIGSHLWLTFLLMPEQTLDYAEFCDYSHRKDSTAFTYISSFQPEIPSIYYQSEKVGHIPRMHVLRSSVWVCTLEPYVQM